MGLESLCIMYNPEKQHFQKQGYFLKYSVICPIMQFCGFGMLYAYKLIFRVGDKLGISLLICITYTLA